MTKGYWKKLNGKIGPSIKKEISNLIKCGKYTKYANEENHGDNIISIYGDLNNNLLYMTLRNKNKVFYGRINSPVLFPKMCDRIFGMDQMDVQAANWLSDMLIYVNIDGFSEEQVLKKWDSDFGKYEIPN